MNEEKLKCIKALQGNNNDEYFHKWIAFRTVYQPILDEGAYSSEVKYNTHNYSTHCVNIYKNIDKLIDWNSDNKPTVEELFYLDVAVILHDLCMAVMPQKRPQHSKEAYEIILNKINSPDRNEINGLLKLSEAECIAEIILGHSDVKVEEKSEDTIKYLIDKYRGYVESEYETNRICHLAVILRLADELDVTYDRINRKFTEMSFDTEDENDRVSMKHYRKLQLVKKITQDKDENNRLILEINDKEFGIESGDDEDLIAEVKNKIESELQNTNRVFSAFAQRLCPYKKFDTVYIKSYDNPTKEKELNEYAEKCKKKIKRGYNSASLDKNLGEIILNKVVQKDLFLPGHYLVNEKICSRDWIDTEKLMQEESLKEKIICTFEKMITHHIKENNFIILGVGTVGSQIGSILAYRLCSPFLHIVPKHLEQYYDEHEISKVELEKGIKYIIISDVVITGLTIGEVCRKYEILMEEIIGIYCIFKRSYNLERIKVEEKEILQKVQAINTDFDAELRTKATCKLFNQYGRCICNNKILN